MQIYQIFARKYGEKFHITGGRRYKNPGSGNSGARGGGLSFNLCVGLRHVDDVDLAVAVEVVCGGILQLDRALDAAVKSGNVDDVQDAVAVHIAGDHGGNIIGVGSLETAAGAYAVGKAVAGGREACVFHIVTDPTGVALLTLLNEGQFGEIHGEQV